jgi:hypothetical protein
MANTSNNTQDTSQAKPSAPNLIDILETDGGALAMQVAQPPIAFHRVFVEVTGSVTAALLLSACIDQEQETPVKANADGWVPTSADLWLQRTALSVKEQATARRTLRDLKLMEERLSGFPAQLAVELDGVIQPIGRVCVCELEATQRVSGHGS